MIGSEVVVGPLIGSEVILGSEIGSEVVVPDMVDSCFCLEVVGLWINS